MAAAQVVGAPTEQVSVGVSAFGALSRLPEEAKLEWFFTAGQSLFEASTFGALLERQSAFGQQFETCPKCEGSGFDAGDNSCPTCRGMGGKPVPRADTGSTGRERQQGLLFGTTRCQACIRMPRGRWSCKGCDGYGYLEESGACCLACKGSGEKLTRTGKHRKRASRRPRPEPCWSCKGALYHLRSPVGLKAAPKTEPSYTPDDGDLRRFAEVSRWLRHCSADTVDTLAEFFGLSGYLWGNTRWGRLFGVVPLTTAGARALAKLENPHDVADHYLLVSYVDHLQRLKGHERERANEWLELVTRQAAARFLAARDDWTRVVVPPPPPAPPAEASSEVPA